METVGSGLMSPLWLGKNKCTCSSHLEMDSGCRERVPWPLRQMPTGWSEHIQISSSRNKKTYGMTSIEIKLLKRRSD